MGFSNSLAGRILIPQYAKSELLHGRFMVLKYKIIGKADFFVTETRFLIAPAFRPG